MLSPARVLRAALLAFPFAASLPAAPQNVLVLGDSLSEEYAFELPFSAPDSDPFRANLRNWIELLAATRPAEISFGSYDGNLAAYPDYRDGGHAYNWAVPGFKTTDLVEFINPPLLPRDELELLDALSCPKLKSQLKDDIAWVVIFCSGNDLSSLYSELASDTATPAQLAAIRDNLAATIDFVRAQNAALKIVLVNAPDIGATPAVQARGATPEARAVATAGIASLNTLLAALAADRGIALADSFTLTRRIAEAAPLRLNGTAFLPTAHPENDPHHLFAKDGFHASTALQALIANEILGALNTRYAAGFTLLSGREILRSVGLEPDQPLQHRADRRSRLRRSVAPHRIRARPLAHATGHAAAAPPPRVGARLRRTFRISDRPLRRLRPQRRRVDHRSRRPLATRAHRVDLGRFRRERSRAPGRGRPPRFSPATQHARPMTQSAG